MNTELAERMMRERYPLVAGKITTVMNGADPELRRPGTFGSTFVISYAGHIYGGRDPRTLFRGVKRAIDEVGIPPGDLEVRFMGSDSVDGSSLTSVAAESGLDGYFVSEPLQVRKAALDLLERSAMVVVLPQKYRHSIPGKVFEYVQTQSWILSLAEPGSATDLMLRETNADIVSPDDEHEIATVIARRYREYQAAIRPLPINADGHFDRTRQSDKLFKAIDQLLLERRQAPAATRRSSALVGRAG
jgi:hypothetical protein